MNISIFVMYGSDRRSQLEQMIEINSRIDGWEEAEKILLVDGEVNIEPEGFRVIEVARNENEDFVWGNMWEAGVNACNNEWIWYLDSDRVLAKNYLKLIEENIADNRLLFTDSLFNFTKPVETDFIINLLDNYDLERMFLEIDKFKDKIVFEPRFKLPLDKPGKSPASGNLVFAKTNYKQLDEVDQYYKGHGAWMDNDVHQQWCSLGLEMFSLNVSEFHIWHSKLGEDGELSQRDIELLSLRNFVFYANKWGINLSCCRAIAAYLNLESNYVDTVLENIENWKRHED